jgi:uncharacterized protein YceK
MFRKSTLVVALSAVAVLPLLSGCTGSIIMHNPKTGETAQCNENGVAPLWQHEAETCAEGYEKLGWQRVN